MPFIKSMDLIFGRDVDTRNTFLLYGRKTLERLARTEQKENLNVMGILLDQDTDELEMACALIQVLKGRHDYNR